MVSLRYTTGYHLAVPSGLPSEILFLEFYSLVQRANSAYGVVHCARLKTPLTPLLTTPTNSLFALKSIGTVCKLVSPVLNAVQFAPLLVETNTPPPAVTVDVAIFTIAADDLKVLLIRRGAEPYQGKWALPGGFVEMNESLDQAAARELKEEVGVSDVYLEQLFTFGAPKRDPRGRVISVCYFALIDVSRQTIRAASDAADAQWHSVFKLPRLAFDHRQILDYAIWRLRNKLEWTTVGYELLPKKFTLSELQRVYEIILQKPVDKRNFRKRILAQGQITELKETRQDGAHRPAQLYSFKAKSSLAVKVN